MFKTIGRIRRNVNWTARITDGETGDTGFSVVGWRNPIIVHVGGTDSGRTATVKFEQCELPVGEEEYKWDEVRVRQKSTRVFTLYYNDYDADTHSMSDGAFVEFMDMDGNTLLSTEIHDGMAEYVDTTGNIESVRAVITSEREYPEYIGLTVSDTELYQTGLISTGIRSANTSANYDQVANAWIDYDVTYDNNDETVITSSATLNMKKKSEQRNPSYSEIGDNITASGKTVRFSRNNVNEVSSGTTYADTSVVVNGENGDSETVLFKAPKRAKLKYDTDFKWYDTPENGTSGVTSTMFDQDSFTTDLYDPEVFTYVRSPKTPVDSSVTIDYRYDGNTICTANVPTPTAKNDQGEIVEWPSYSAVTGRHEIVVLYNDDIEFDSEKADVVTRIGNEEKYKFNSYAVQTLSHGGGTQIRMPNEANTEWAQENLSKEGSWHIRCNPGFLRRTDCPENSLKIFSCRIESANTTPTNVSVSVDHKWSDMYFSNDNSNSPTNNYVGVLRSTAFIVPSDGISGINLYTGKASSFSYDRFVDMNKTEVALTNLYNSLMSSSAWTLAVSSVAEDYPQFGYMEDSNSKYILFDSVNKRNIVIVSRDSGASESSKIEDDISKKFTYPQGVSPLKDINASVLFTEEDGELVPNGAVWDNCGPELEHCKNMIIAVYKKNSQHKVFNLNNDNQLVGFVYQFDMTQQEELNSYAIVGVEKDVNDTSFNKNAFIAKTRFIERVNVKESSWHVAEDVTPEVSEMVSGGTEWMSVNPILMTRSTTDSGLACLININNDSNKNNLRYTYQISPENGTLRYSSLNYRNKWHEVKQWKGIGLTVSPNNTGGIRMTSINLIHKDKYHYDKVDFINKTQEKLENPIGYLYYDEGNTVRFNSKYDIIQLGPNTTEAELAQFVCDNKDSFHTKYPSTFYGVYLTKDKAITNPKKYDFSNYTYSPFYERLTFVIPSGGSAKISFNRTAGTTGKLEFAYSSEYTTAVTWYDTSVSTNTAATLSGTNTLVTFRGKLVPSGNNGIGSFSITGNCIVSGSVMSILYENERQHTSFNGEKSYIFKDLFKGCTGITDAGNLYLPSGNVINGCYSGMFKGCTSLTEPPMLQAWDSEENCYDGIYSGCTNLKKIYVMTQSDPQETGIWNGITANGGTVTRNSKSTWTALPQSLADKGWTAVAESSGRT